MAEQKSFWKKYELIIITIITLLFIYLIVFFNQKINFLLGNELIISLTPAQKSLYMHYGNVSKAEFDVTIDSVAYCKANCLYSFTDNSKNEIIDKSDFEISKGQHFTKSYDLSVKKLGSGQDIYGFEVRCHSIRSFFCLTKSSETSRSSLVTVNYDLTETEKELKRILKQNVTKLLEQLAETDILHQEVNQKFFQLGFKANLLNLSKQKINIDDNYDKIRISVENLRSLWAIENYIRLNQLFNESLFKTLSGIKEDMGNLDKSINNSIKIHNDLLLGLSKLSEDLKQLNSFVNILEDNKTLENTKITITDFNKLASSLTNNTFDSYNNVIKELANVVEQQALIIQ